MVLGTIDQYKVPMGDPYDFTDEQLEQLSQSSALDIQLAIIAWHQNAEEPLIALIDAKSGTVNK